MIVADHACIVGQTRTFGGHYEDLASTLINQGAQAVIASPMLIDDMMGKKFSDYFYGRINPVKKTILQTFYSARCLTEEFFRKEDPFMWPLWTMLRYRGNPYLTDNSTDDMAS